MKKLICLAVILMSAMWAMAQDREFTVSGEVRSDLKEVMILSDEKGEPKPIATVPVTNGLFSYTGTQPDGAVLGVGTEKYYLPFFNDGTPITVFFVDNVNGDMKVEGMPLLLMSGSDQNVQLAKTDRALDSYNESFSKVLKELNEKATADNLEQLRNEAYEAYMANINGRANELKKCRETMIPAVYLPQMMQDLSYEQLKEFMIPEAPYYNHPNMTAIKEYYNTISLKQPGQPFHDVSIPDEFGRQHKLSEWCGKGNYVLVDFWASWCGPCRQEMPNVVECYNKYHGKKKFDVIGISLDEKANNWKAAVKQLNMPWTQLSDLKGWNSEAAAAYGVTAIPSNVLIDPQGQIIGTDLRGEELKATLAELLDD